MIVTGKIDKGNIRLNDELKLISVSKTIRTQCTFLEKYHQVVKKAKQGEYVALAF